MENKTIYINGVKTKANVPDSLLLSIPIKCKECGEEFYPTNIRNTKYCSPKCGARHQGRKVCEKCGAKCYGTLCRNCITRKKGIVTPEYIRKRGKK